MLLFGERVNGSLWISEASFCFVLDCQSVGNFCSHEEELYTTQPIAFSLFWINFFVLFSQPTSSKYEFCSILFHYVVTKEMDESARTVVRYKKRKEKYLLNIQQRETIISLVVDTHHAFVEIKVHKDPFPSSLLVVPVKYSKHVWRQSAHRIHTCTVSLSRVFVHLGQIQRQFQSTKHKASPRACACSCTYVKRICALLFCAEGRFSSDPSENIHTFLHRPFYCFDLSSAIKKLAARLTNYSKSFFSFFFTSVCAWQLQTRTSIVTTVR